MSEVSFGTMTLTVQRVDLHKRLNSRNCLAPAWLQIRSSNAQGWVPFALGISDRRQRPLLPPGLGLPSREAGADHKAQGP